MTRLKIEVCGENDAAAVSVLRQLLDMMARATDPLRPGYSTGATSGCSVCDVTRESDK